MKLKIHGCVANLGSEHGGWVDDAAGAHDDGQVAGAEGGPGRVQHTRLQILPEPDDVWAEQAWDMGRSLHSCNDIATE